MYNLNKFKGVFPAFYACYEDNGDISPVRTKALVDFLFQKGIRGLYITGSSGECIYQTTAERKVVMESVANAAKGRMVVIAHVGAPSTRDSIELASFAKHCGIDAISSIPPIYYSLSEAAIKAYWEAIIEAAKLPFIIYNLPKMTGFNISKTFFKTMLQNPYVIGMKNTSLPVMDIQQYKSCGGDNCIIFNGPDEQFAAGLLMGADGGIGGTYCIMPELYLKIYDLIINEKNIEKASLLQRTVTSLIIELLSMKGDMLSATKEILKIQGLNIGKTARLPLNPLEEEDFPKIDLLEKKIKETVRIWCK